MLCKGTTRVRNMMVRDLACGNTRYASYTYVGSVIHRYDPCVFRGGKVQLSALFLDHGDKPGV